MLTNLKILVLSLLTIGCSAIKPFEFAKKAGDMIIQSQDTFFKWDYGGAIILDGLHSFKKTFNLSYLDTIDSCLTKFKTDPHSNFYGYKLMTNQTIPFDKAIGDGIGLFPINYFTRAIENLASKESESDLLLTSKVLLNYILAWPYRLPDGTFSRHEGWPRETDKNASFLWGDDQFMGITLLCRVAKEILYSDYVVTAAKQAIRFASHMMDPADGLFFHGYNDADHKTSCCKWGRANGWGMISHAEVLEALDSVAGNVDPSYKQQMLTILKKHTEGVIKTQSEDGRWHQVMTANDTFLETSATAMFLSTMARSVTNGWIPYSQAMDNSIQKAWSGLQKTIQNNGSVSGICMGTGIQTSIGDYNKRGTLYELSGPGLGSVLYAVRDYYNYSRRKQQGQ